MKKTLLLCTMLLTITLTKAQTVGDAFTVNEINYTVTATDPTNEVQVVGSSGTQTAVAIPATVNNGGNDFNVTFIKKGAFSANKIITSLVVSGDTQIDQQVFNACSNLVSADLSNITTSIGKNSFVNCIGLETVNLSKATHIDNSAFKGCTSLTTVDISNVTSTGLNVFDSCTSLTSIDLTSIIHLGAQAFKGSGLTSASLPSATAIGGLAFWNCSDLVDVNIPVVDSLAAGAFNGAGITKLTLPATVRKLPGFNTFRNIPALEELTVEFETPFVLDLGVEGDLASHMFSSQIGTNAKLIVPFGTSSAFAAENGWNIFNITEAEATAAVNEISNKSFDAYPNPVVDILTFSTNDIFSVDIYNTIGAKVVSLSAVSGVDMSNLNQGIYYVKCKNKEGVAISTIKVVKN